MSIVISMPITINTTSVLSQVDISDFFTRCVITGFGAQIGQDSSIESAWDIGANTLGAFIDSGSYKDNNAEDIDMFFTMNAYGDVLGLSLKATFGGGVKISGDFVPADINSTRQQILKQSYQAYEALEGISTASTNSMVASMVLDALGYYQVVNLISVWDNEILTATIEFDSAKLDGIDISTQKIIISTDSYSDTYNSGILDNIQEFVYKVGNYAMTDIYNAGQVVKAANHTLKLTNNISFDLYKEGTDTNQDLIIDNGELRINENYDFDVIKLTDISTYTQNINISDAIDVLRHIVDLETLTGSAFHAADVDNNGSVNISDAIDILRHIVNLETIDTFDLIDDSGNRISELDASALGDAPTWMLVANGDVDMSGEFGSDYVITSDLV